MQNKIDLFRKYHHQSSPLILGNVWDVPSAKLYENLKFSAIGTSSAAVAAMMGYEDGQNIPFDEYLTIIQKITENVQIPVTVDLEAGFGDTAEQIVANIEQLNKLGIVGINLEDSIVKNDVRVLVDAELFAVKLEKIREALQANNLEVFINLRSDSFLLQLPNALEESLRRIEIYKDHIDGIFLPCITEAAHIRQITAQIDLPLNVMCMPDLLDFKTLTDLGVSRISMGNFMHSFLSEKLEEATKSIIDKQNFSPLFEKVNG